MKKYVHANEVVTAATEEDSQLAQTIDKLEEDFEYIIASFEKLDRSGAEERNKGTEIAEKLLDTFQQAVSHIAEILA